MTAGTKYFSQERLRGFHMLKSLSDLFRMHSKSFISNNSNWIETSTFTYSKYDLQPLKQITILTTFDWMTNEIEYYNVNILLFVILIINIYIYKY